MSDNSKQSTLCFFALCILLASVAFFFIETKSPAKDSPYICTSIEMLLAGCSNPLLEMQKDQSNDEALQNLPH